MKMPKDVKYDAQGLIPAIIQDAGTGQVLMMAYMNEESLKRTLAEGKCCFWSRSRQQLWLKGETSGNVQTVKEAFIDCDNDTLLFKVEQVGGAACHTGYRSCFYRKMSDEGLEVVGERIFDPEKVYGKKQP
jgi:phosphoribosyl-AMP cyclohydrolase